MSKFEFSSYQKDIFLSIAKGHGHILVEARAGSAKTTSLIESLRFIPSNKKVLVLAFNKVIQKELEDKIHRTNVEIRTFHSLGLKAIIARFGKVQINAYKVMNLLKDLNNYELASNIEKTISYIKYCLNDSPSNIEHIINTYGIDLCEMEMKEFISIVIKTLGESKKDTSSIDFNDMCYFPFVYGLSLGEYDFVYIDETQDTNRSQTWMAKGALKSDGRLISFGDPFQKIYSFRMADYSQITDLKKIATTKVLPLPISYRCPKSIIGLSQKIVPDIQHAVNAVDGSISEIMSDVIYDNIKAGDVILSRTNAPIMKIAMNLLKLKKRFTILGKDIGDELLYLIKKSKKKKITDFIKWVNAWMNSEIDRLKAKGIKPDNMIDKAECLIGIAEDSKSIEDCKNKIKDMFDSSDKGSIITLSSLHMSKGLEWDNVFLLKWTLRHFPNDDIIYTPDPNNDEANLAYIGFTRAKKNLYLVNKSK
jgi:DNA helicase-2/ATP-dependent DNA helicase PcrA